MRRRRWPVAGLGLLLGTLCSSALGQPKRTVTSPEITQDGRVVFRIHAPGATRIELSGDWMTRAQSPLPLTKGEDSIWSATIPAPALNIYTYRFLIDGVPAADPASDHSIVAGGRFPASVLEISGNGARPWDLKKVPNGTVHVESFYSGQQKRTKGFYVYTPASYGSPGGRKYPTLVLLPGTPATEADWVNVGFVSRILDNMIAERAIKEMVVLMPRSDVLVSAGTRADNLAIFEPQLLNEVLPAFEQRYRVEHRPESRALAGVSLGGELAFTVGFRHPEKFRWLGSLAGSLFEKEFDARYQGGYARPDEVNRTYRLIWLACGADDGFLQGARKLSALLTKRGVKHTYREKPGLHNFPAFREQLVEFLPLLFR